MIVVELRIENLSDVNMFLIIHFSVGRVGYAFDIVDVLACIGR